MRGLRADSSFGAKLTRNCELLLILAGIRGIVRAPSNCQTS